MDTAFVPDCPSSGNGASRTASPIRRAAVKLPAMSVSGSRMTNSSPPGRKARSTSTDGPPEPSRELDQHRIAGPVAVPVID